MFTVKAIVHKEPKYGYTYKLDAAQKAISAIGKALTMELVTGFDLTYMQHYTEEWDDACLREDKFELIQRLRQYHALKYSYNNPHWETTWGIGTGALWGGDPATTDTTQSGGIDKAMEYSIEDNKEGFLGTAFINPSIANAYGLHLENVGATIHNGLQNHNPTRPVKYFANSVSKFLSSGDKYGKEAIIKNASSVLDEAFASKPQNITKAAYDYLKSEEKFQKKVKKEGLGAIGKGISRISGFFGTQGLVGKSGVESSMDKMVENEVLISLHNKGYIVVSPQETQMLKGKAITEASKWAENELHTRDWYNPNTVISERKWNETVGFVDIKRETILGGHEIVKHAVTKEQSEITTYGSRGISKEVIEQDIMNRKTSLMMSEAKAKEKELFSAYHAEYIAGKKVITANIMKTETEKAWKSLPIYQHYQKESQQITHKISELKEKRTNAQNEFDAMRQEHQNISENKLNSLSAPIRSAEKKIKEQEFRKHKLAKEVISDLQSTVSRHKETGLSKSREYIATVISKTGVPSSLKEYEYLGTEPSNVVFRYAAKQHENISICGLPSGGAHEIHRYIFEGAPKHITEALKKNQEQMHRQITPKVSPAHKLSADLTPIVLPSDYENVVNDFLDIEPIKTIHMPADWEDF